MPARKSRNPLPPNVIRLADYRPAAAAPQSEEKANLLRLMTELRDQLDAAPPRRGKYDVSAQQQALIDASAALLATAAWLRELNQ